MTEYKIVEGSDLEVLAAEVQRNLAEGWEPIGGVSVIPAWIEHGDPSGYRYLDVVVSFAQAMIRYATGMVEERLGMG